jgi:YrbI family 3-deoxy-D-manno-octulosonate 8-phosphate phosphatase
MSRAGVQSALRGVKLVAFDFDGVFTDNRVWVFQDGREAVVCSRGDSMGLSLLRRHGIHLVVISTETNPVVRARCRKLKIPAVTGCDDKLAALKRLCRRLGVALEDAAFFGNDINDADCLRAVGLPVVPADAHPAVVPLARLRTRALGGNGAVRELCDRVDAARTTPARGA